MFEELYEKIKQKDDEQLSIKLIIEEFLKTKEGLS
jgi:hypothetical protein